MELCLVEALPCLLRGRERFRDGAEGKVEAAHLEVTVSERAEEVGEVHGAECPNGRDALAHQPDSLFGLSCLDHRPSPQRTGASRQLDEASLPSEDAGLLGELPAESPVAAKTMEKDRDEERLGFAEWMTERAGERDRVSTV